MRGKLRHIKKLFSKLGAPAATKMVLLGAEEQFRDFWGLPKPRTTVSLRIKGFTHPIYFRKHSSDKWVFQYVFVHDDFGPLEHLEDVSAVIDLGANIGLASVLFLQRYPNARLLALEPDQENFELCQKNIAPFGERAEVLQRGVWSHSTALKIVPVEQGSKNEWSISVREPKEEETGDIEAMSVCECLDFLGVSQVDIMKIDVEGTEEILFGDNPSMWLDSTRNMFVEVHGTKAQEIFDQAMKEYHYSRIQHQDNIYCLGIRRKEIAASTRSSTAESRELL